MQQINPAFQEDADDDSQESDIEKVEVCIGEDVNRRSTQSTPLLKRQSEDCVSSEQLPEAALLSENLVPVDERHDALPWSAPSPPPPRRGCRL